MSGFRHKPRRSATQWYLGVMGLSLACLAGCAAGGPSWQPAMTPGLRAANLASFDHVWERIRDRHYDPNLNDLDWYAIRDELRPKVEAAKSLPEARRVMQDMINRLGESHFAIVPGDVYEKIDFRRSRKGRGADEAVSPDEEKTGNVGIHVRVIDGQALVVSVDENSPAADLGVRPGWVVVAIDGESLDKAIASVSKVFADSPLREMVLSRVVESQLAGPVGDAALAEFLDEHDKPRSLELPFAEPPGKEVVLGAMPAMRVACSHHRIGADVGYITLSSFFDPSTVMPEFRAAIADFADARGVILDLRGNPGGIAGMAMGISGLFIAQPNQMLGTMKTRETSLKFVVMPQADTYDGPLAILVDGCSASTSEFLAGGLQDLGRARILGVRTPGAALPSTFERLPNGDGFQYAFADYVSTGGTRLEGHGVVPDEVAAPNRGELLAGHDTAIDAAVRWIHAQSETNE